MLLIFSYIYTLHHYYCARFSDHFAICYISIYIPGICGKRVKPALVNEIDSRGQVVLSLENIRLNRALFHHCK